MNDLQQKVARAICLARQCQWCTVQCLAQNADLEKAGRVNQARAAIAVMKEHIFEKVAP